MKSFINTQFEKRGYSLKRIPLPTPDFKTFDINDRINHYPFDNTLEVSKEILSFFSKVDPLYATITSGPLKIAGAWAQDLKNRRKDQLNAISSNDPIKYALLLSNLFRNNLISGMWYHIYFQDYSKSKVVPVDLIQDIQKLENLTGRDVNQDLCQNSNFGNPWGFNINGKILKPIDAWMAYQAHTSLGILNLNQKSNSTNKIKTYCEIGSGFGGAASQLLRWYSEKLRIVLIDLPLNLVSAYAYLKAEHPKLKHTLVSSVDQLKSTLSNYTQETEIIFVPSCFVETLRNLDIDLLFNAGSFSEMNYETIQFYLETLCGNQTKFLIEINSNQKQLNNDNHIEVPSNEFPVPSQFKLLTRSISFPNIRHLTSCYMNENFIRWN